MGEKFWELPVGLVHGQNGEIAPDHDPASECGNFLDKPTKVGIHLWSTTRDIDGVHSGVFQGFEAVTHGLADHDFLSIRARINVAVSTGLVAHLSHIDLQNFNLDGPQRLQADLGNPFFEAGKTINGLAQNLELPTGI